MGDLASPPGVMQIQKYFTIHNGITPNAYLISKYPDGSLVKEIAKLQESGIVNQFYIDAELGIFNQIIDETGYKRVGMRLATDYTFSTRNKIYILTKYKPVDVQHEMKLSIIVRLYPECVIIHEYGKVLEYINQFGEKK